nr:structural maintenance of chromosomes protein 5 [Quercus suber]
MEAKEHEKDAKKKLDEAAKTFSDLKEPIEKQKQEKAVLDAKCKKAGRLVNENSKRLTELMSNESPLLLTARYLSFSFLDNLKAQILELEVSANNKRNRKSEKERLLGQKKMSLRNCLDRLKDMENTHNKCLQALMKFGAERISEAYHWLQDHHNEFNKAVYGHVLLEVNVSDRVHANYLEGHVPYYIWKVRRR